MKLSGMLVLMLLVVDLAQGAAGREWAGGQGPHAGAPALTQAPAAATAIPIIRDPLGAATDPIVDIATVEGGTDGVNVTLRINFSPDTVMSQVVGFIDLDTDQNPTTGAPPSANFFIPGTTQDIGVDFSLRLLSLPSGGIVDVINVLTDVIVGSVPTTISGQMIEVTIPLTILGGDDGGMNVGMALGNTLAPTDAAPDVGHGTIPASGKAIISPGSSTMVTTQVFDLVFILDTFGNPITEGGISISVNGIDITALVLGIPPVLGSTPTGQLTIRLPTIHAASLGEGSHTFSIVVTTPVGAFGDTATYAVAPTTE